MGVISAEGMQDVHSALSDLAVAEVRAAQSNRKERGQVSRTL